MFFNCQTRDDPTDGGILNIPLAARVHNTQTFWKNTKNDNIEYLKLRLKTNNAEDELIVRIISESSFEFDGKFDAFKRFSSNGEVPQIYTSNSQMNTDYAINSVPFINKESLFPLGISVQNSGNYYFELTEDTLKANDIYIEDLYNENVKKMSEGDKFYFNYEGGNVKDRFLIKFKEKTLTNDTNSEVQFNIYPNPCTKNVFINIPDEKMNAEVILYDISGKILKAGEIHGIQSEIDMRLYPKGVYFIKIITDKGVYKQKVIKI